MKVRWVTPLGVDTASTSYCSSSASRPSHSRTPRPSRIGDLHDMQMVDEPGVEELAQHRRAPTDADVLTVCRLPSNGECIH